MLSSALFALHTDDCGRADRKMLSLKHFDDAVILDAFKELLSSAGTFASCPKKQSPASESIQNKRLLKPGCNLTPPITSDSRQRPRRAGG